MDDVRVILGTGCVLALFGCPVGVPHPPVTDLGIEDPGLGELPTLVEPVLADLVVLAP